MNYVLKSQLKRLCYNSYESAKGDCLFDTDTCIYNAWWKQDFFFPLDLVEEGIVSVTLN